MNDPKEGKDFLGLGTLGMDCSGKTPPWAAESS